MRCQLTAVGQERTNCNDAKHLKAREFEWHFFERHFLFFFVSLHVLVHLTDGTISGKRCGVVLFALSCLSSTASRWILNLAIKPLLQLAISCLFYLLFIQ